jgi:hypothetical protein
MNRIEIYKNIDIIFSRVTELIIVHLLFFVLGKEGTSDLFDEQIIQKIIYTIIALIIYHFIIKKVIIKVKKMKKKK